MGELATRAFRWIGECSDRNTLIFFSLCIVSFFLISFRNDLPTLDFLSLTDPEKSSHESLPVFPRTPEFYGPFDLFPWHVFPKPDLVNVSNLPPKYQSKKIISLFLGNAETRPILDSSIFTSCPFSECAITSHSKLYSQSHAIIFMPGHAYYNLTKGPKMFRAFPDQIFIYYQGESSHNGLGVGWLLDKDFFNWTMTLRLDSDIRSHFTYVTKLQVRRRNFARKKIGLVSWFVSNCGNPISGREEYVAQLRKYLNVTIFGNCKRFRTNNTLDCPRDLALSGASMCQKNTMRKFKFYLAFENSICGDYISEKTRNAIEAESVPVVLGGGNYDRLYPPHSLINVRDFRSPAVLAEYLLELDRNDTKYNEYMKWKYNPKYVKSFGQLAAKESGYCQLCKKLHRLNDTGSDTHRRVYERIFNWELDRKGQCSPGFKMLPDGTSNLYKPKVD